MHKKFQKKKSKNFQTCSFCRHYVICVQYRTQIGLIHIPVTGEWFSVVGSDEGHEEREQKKLNIVEL